jgi:hypothetical protein
VNKISLSLSQILIKAAEPVCCKHLKDLFIDQRITSCLSVFIDLEIKKLDYNSPELKPLRMWLDNGKEKDTPIDSELSISLYMNKSLDVQLLKDLAHFELPPFKRIDIYYLRDSASEVKHFLAHSFGQLSELCLNYDCYDLDGSKWEEAIAKAIPKVKNSVCLCNFSFRKKQMEIIVGSSFHLKSLGFRG